MAHATNWTKTRSKASHDVKTIRIVRNAKINDDDERTFTMTLEEREWGGRSLHCTMTHTEAKKLSETLEYYLKGEEATQETQPSPDCDRLVRVGSGTVWHWATGSILHCNHSGQARIPELHSQRPLTSKSVEEAKEQLCKKCFPSPDHTIGYLKREQSSMHPPAMISEDFKVGDSVVVRHAYLQCHGFTVITRHAHDSPGTPEDLQMQGEVVKVETHPWGHRDSANSLFVVTVKWPNSTKRMSGAQLRGVNRVDQQ